MRYNVKFQSSISEKEPPLGENLARSIVAAHRSKDVDIELIDSYEDFAWWLEGSGNKPRPWILVGFVDDGAYQWLLQINSGSSWFQRLRGRTDAEQRDSIALAVHDILTQGEDFSNIRWHEGDFADENWTDCPDA